MNPLKKFLLVTLLALPLQFGQADIVLNEIYGGGNNAGAPFNQDFVELFNNGSTSINIGGWILQYGSATGSFSTFATLPSVTLAPGSYYLVSAGPVGSTNGAPLPTVDFAGSTGTNFSATAGKIQLLNASAVVMDLVGYGASANMSETAPAPAPSNTTSISRTGGIDTNNNSVDFTTGAPTPTAMVPEPATYMLLGVGLLVCAQHFRRRRSSERR